MEKFAWKQLWLYIPWIFLAESNHSSCKSPSLDCTWGSLQKQPVSSELVWYQDIECIFSYVYIHSLLFRPIWMSSHFAVWPQKKQPTLFIDITVRHIILVSESNPFLKTISFLMSNFEGILFSCISGFITNSSPFIKPSCISFRPLICIDLYLFTYAWCFFFRQIQDKFSVLHSTICTRVYTSTSQVRTNVYRVRACSLGCLMYSSREFQGRECICSSTEENAGILQPSSHARRTKGSLV